MEKEQSNFTNCFSSNRLEPKCHSAESSFQVMLLLSYSFYNFVMHDSNGLRGLHGLRGLRVLHGRWQNQIEKLLLQSFGE